MDLIEICFDGIQEGRVEAVLAVSEIEQEHIAVSREGRASIAVGLSAQPPAPFALLVGRRVRYRRS